MTVVPPLALLVDRIAGTPSPAVHPVVWMGRLLDVCAASVAATSRRSRRSVSSVGLPGAVRLSAQPPAARGALVTALREVLA